MAVSDGKVYKRQSFPQAVVTPLQLRLLDQCYKYSCHHLGSAFSTLPILEEIYKGIKPEDRFILSNGHAANALYVVLEHFRGELSDYFFENMGDHPKRDISKGVFCSTGSLGMGITVAVGMALGNRNADVSCVISDGECAEGSVWESLRFARKARLSNLHIYVNMNGWSAYDAIDTETLENELMAVYPKIKIRKSDGFPFDKLGLKAHYLKMDSDLYKELRERICGQIS